jgi:peptide/nickel transport system permease protein
MYKSALKRWLLSYPVIPGAIILVVIIVALFAPYLATHSPTRMNLPSRLVPPCGEYPFGTDSLGRDILSRIIFGARISLLVAFLAIFGGGAIGVSVGTLSGYLGGRVDAVLMRATDAMLAFPGVFIAMLFAVALGPSLKNVVIAIILVMWARYARVIRGEVLSLKEQDFVALAKVAGASSVRIMFLEIFPNILNTCVIMLTLQVGWVILMEATLSFLGAGIPPPTPAWGSMVADGRQYVATAWWITVFPGVSIFLTALSFNLVGDWLREALDPKLRQLSLGG